MAIYFDPLSGLLKNTAPTTAQIPKVNSSLPDIFAQTGMTPSTLTPTVAPAGPQPKITTNITTPFDTGDSAPTGTGLFVTTPLTPTPTGEGLFTPPPPEVKGPPGGPGDKDKPTTTGLTSSQLDSIAAIKALLSAYGLGDLTDSITNAVIKGYSSDTIQLIMQDPNSSDPLALAFQKRFPANKARAAAGKSVLSPAEYLAAERSYTQVLQSYGVASMATRDKLSSFITNDISAAEVSDRVGLAVNRVQNADNETKKMLAQYYPMLNQADIVGAVLDPAEGLPALQRKIQISEIGGAALAQNLTTGIKAASDLKTGYTGLTTGAMGAEELAALGVTKEQARAGYQTVAEVAPRGEFLSSISTGEDYTRLQAEQEAFQGLASAKRARVNLTQTELARFGGQSGTSKGAFSTGYLSRQGKSGAF